MTQILDKKWVFGTQKQKQLKNFQKMMMKRKKIVTILMMMIIMKIKIYLYICSLVKYLMFCSLEFYVTCYNLIKNKKV